MSNTAVLPGTRRSVERIDEACAANLAPGELLDRVVQEIDEVMPTTALFVQAVDPETMLGMGAGMVRGLPERMCEPFWAYEFEVPDFNKFTDLVRGPRAVADLHTATGGRPERSARWREFQGYGELEAELRGMFTAGGHGWGMIQLNRGPEHGAFTAPEVEFVETIAPKVGRALRRATATQYDCSTGTGPGMAILDGDFNLLSATQEAIHWFERVQTYRRRDAGRLGVRMPYEVINAAQSARAKAARGEASATRTRVRSECGIWMLIHASCLAESSNDGQTAIVIEPAKASEVVPLIVEAYELTARELDVTRALVRGLTTNEIATELFLSRYTVQDHLKRIYDKVGVSSRGGLVAKMFAEHYHQRMDIERR